MSKQVDERVVSMQFDNAHFEKNVSTTMSTLDKLKHALKLDGASKGLEDINSAAGKVNMSGLSGAVETVKLKFSALDVVAVTALANITNKAVDAGERLVKSLSIDQITEGWQKFSDKTTSVATLVAQGNAIEDVNDQLDRLNWFTDETSYNFTEMVANIAKFTATGKGLEESVTAMEGIANWAALSGQNASTASRAMYQLSQAMGAGVMRLEDYKSIQNASMDTEEFRQKCLDAAVSLGTLQDNGDGTYKSLVDGASDTSFTISQFTRNLTDGMWLTSDVMMNVFNTYSSAVEGIYKAAEEKGMLASEIIDEIYTTAEKKGISTDEAIKELGYGFDSFALKAFEAAQKARTFNDAIDSVKDAVSTGWMKTFELIFGDAEKATELWTDLANTLYDIFAAGGEIRNEILESALGKSFKTLGETLSTIKKTVSSVGETISTVTEPIKTVTKTLEDYNNVVNEVIRGDWGNYTKRWDALTEAGYDWITVQNMVNEKLGNSYRRQTDFVIGQESMTESTEKTTEANAEYIATLTKLSDAELKALGLTDEQIEAIKEVRKQADKLGMTVEDFLANIDEIDGRWVLINSFKNVWAGLVKVFEAVKAAWEEVFPPKTTEEKAEKLYDIIAAVHKFTTKLIMSDDTAAKVTRTFKGLFAVLDLVRTVLGGGLRIAINLVSKVLGAFDLDILEVTARIGDALVKFRDWALEGNVLAKAFDKLIAKLPTLVNKFKAWFAVFKQTPAVQKLIDAVTAIREAFSKLTSGEINISEFARILGENLAKALKSLPGIALQIGKDFIAGFQNGLSDGISGIIKNIINFCSNFIAGFKEALGVHSPSVIAYAIGAFFIAGFVNGVIDNGGNILATFTDMWNGIVKIFESFWKFLTDKSGNVEWGKIFAGGVIVAGLVLLKKLTTAFTGIASGVEGIGSVLYGVGKSLNSFSKVLNGVAWDLKAQALQKMAIAIAILVASIWVLTTIDDIGKLWNAVAVIGVLAIIVVGLAGAMALFNKSAIVFDKESKKISASGIQSAMLQIGITILALAYAVKLIGDLDPEKAKQGFAGLAGVAAGLIIFLAAMGGISRYSGDAEGIGKMMLKMAVAMGIMAIVMKMVAKMDPEDIVVGLAVMEAFVLLIIQMGLANRLAGIYGDSFGGNVLKISIAMGIMTIVMKMIAKMDPADIMVGIAVLEAFVLLIAEMALVNRLAGSGTSKFGATVMGMAGAMLILTGVVWLLSKMTPEDILHGLAALEAFVLVIAELLLISKLGSRAKNVAKNILAMSVAIGILAGIAVLLSLVDTKSLLKGVTAVGALGLIMAAMIKATKGTKDVKGNLITMVVAIGVMTAAVVALSFIDGKDLAGAVAVLDSLMLCFALMIKMTSGMKTSKNIRKTLITMIGVIAILAGIIALLSLVDPAKAVPNTLALSVLMLAFASTFKIMNGVKLSTTLTKNLQSMVLVVAEIAAILALMSFLPNPTSAISSAIAIGILLNTLATSMLIMSKAKGNFKITFVQLQSMALVITEVAAILSLMSFLPDPLNMIPSALAIGILLNTLATSMLIMSKTKSNYKTTFVQLQSMALVITEVAAILSAMSFLPNPMNMIPSAIAIGILLNLLATSMLIMSKAKGNFKMTIGQLETMTLVIAEIAAILGIMSALDVQASIPNAIAIGILLNLMATAMLIASYSSQNATSAMTAMLIMGLVVAEIGLVFAMITALHAEATLSMAQALGTVLIAMSVACLIASFIPVAGAIEGAIGLAAFIAIMGVVIAAFGALALIPGFTTIMEKGAEIFTTIGEAIGGFCGGIISGIGSAVISLIPPLGEALGDFGENIKPFLTVVEGTSAETVAKAGFLTAIIGALTATAFVEGITSLFGLGLPSLGKDLAKFGGYVSVFSASLNGVNPESVEAAKNVATMLLILTASDVLDGLTSWITGGVNYEEMGTNLKTFGEAVVGFSETISGKIDVAAVEAAANAGALLVELNKSLPRSGGWVQDIIGEQDFGKFAEACKSFATCILEINAVVSQDGFEFQEEKIEQLVKAGTQFSELNNALPKSGGWVQDVVGEKDLSKFGESVKAFTICLIELNSTLSQEGLVIQEEKLGQLAAAGTKFSELNNALPKSGGWVQDVVGEKDLSTFGDSVEHFANCLVKVNTALSQEGFAVNLQGMEDLKQAGLKMNELQSSLPKTGGWWQKLAGKSDIGDFGEKISIFATAIVDFSTSSAGLNTTAIDTAITYANKIKTLVTSLGGLNYDGVEEFTGVGTGGFGADGPPYKIAQAMSAFSEEVANIDTERVTVATTMASELRTLIARLASLDSSGVENFKPQDIGSKMKSYADNVSGIDTALVSESISSANRLKTFISGLTSLDPSGIENFKAASIGSSMKAYADKVAGFDAVTVSESIYAANRLLAFINSTAGLDASGVSSFTSAVEELSTVNVEDIVKAFSGASEKLSTAGVDMINGLIDGMESRLPAVTTVTTGMLSKLSDSIKSKVPMFGNAGEAIVMKLASGIRSKQQMVSTAITSCLTTAVSDIRDKYDSFYNAGSYLVTGFKNGISENSYKAVAKAKAMAEAAEEAAREALKINSPSKVFKEIGSGIPEGFAMGIGMLGSTVDKSVSDMASTAVNSARSSMSTILDALSSDMDTQPTIRPVIDLSDVKTGVDAIGSMFSGTQNVGVQSNLNAINLAMNRKLQNGSNDNIISAINKLNDGLEGNRGDTYNFAGITYDSGDEISEAVQTLVRAAKMGRRV